MLLRSGPAWRSSERTPHPLLAAALAGEPPNLAHLRALCHDLGVVQFARGDTRDLASGFCVDDNARALLVAVDVLELDPKNAGAHHIGEAALRLLERTHVKDDGFHNLLDAKGQFILENGRSDDATGRAAWALGVTAARAPEEQWRTRADRLLTTSWSASRRFKHVRPRAYALLGAAAFAPASRHARSTLEALADSLLQDFRTNATPEWPWWEPRLTWGNARLPEAMLRAAQAAGKDEYAECGLRALGFLGEVTHERNVFVPIGNDGWYSQDGKRARYDQQPIEACAMVDAWLAAAQFTGLEIYRTRALEAFTWFLGRNSERLIVADPQTGGCHDGLGQSFRNRNMGAESTLSYLQAYCSIARLSTRV